MKNCNNCGKEFNKKPSETYERWNNRKYCSKECGYSGSVGRTPVNKGKIIILEKTCKLCGKIFKGRVISKNIWNSKKYCSKKCFGLSQKGKIISEETKNNMSIGRKGMKLSNEHRRNIGKNNRGEKNHLWKGGISQQNRSERENITSSIEYKLWRDAVFLRDLFICQKCGTKGLLNVHHILNFKTYPELRIAIDNGITFCESCHKIFHKKYTRYNNTKLQIEEFISL